MKKLWDSYSYAIILFALGLLAAIILIIRFGVANNEEFMRITVNEGDSLWRLAEDYSAEHSLTSDEFVKWVETNNAISAGRIFPGDELVIPVALNNSKGTQYASKDIE